MESIMAERTYTEDGKRYVFRDIDDGGIRRTQYLTKENWGEEFWNDCDPDADSDVAGARPYEGEEDDKAKRKAKRDAEIAEASLKPAKEEGEGQPKPVDKMPASQSKPKATVNKAKKKPEAK